MDSIDGKLDTRANTTEFIGDWRNLMIGLNRLLEAIIEPIKEAAAVLEEMSNGNLQLRLKAIIKETMPTLKMR